jgi:hypothetical protein
MGRPTAYDVVDGGISIIVDLSQNSIDRSTNTGKPAQRRSRPLSDDYTETDKVTVYRSFAHQHLRSLPRPRIMMAVCSVDAPSA